MAKKGKTMCKWSSDEIEGDLHEVMRMVIHARFICRRCGRAVAKKKFVCKPVKINGEG